MKRYLLTLCLIMSSPIAFANEFSIKILVGSQMEEIVPFWAHIRLTFFNEYPYLYDGTLEASHAYCREVMSYKDAAAIVAYSNNEPIGILTGTSMASYSQHFGEPDAFRAMGIDPNTLYYFGDVIILPEYRGNGLTRCLFQGLESWIVAHGYVSGCFVTESHASHPLKPLGYRELDSLWVALGYRKTHINAQYEWNTIQPAGPSRKQEHVMPYWVKLFKS